MSDLISRQAVLERMADYVASGYADSVEDFEEYSRIVCQLPSAEKTELEPSYDRVNSDLISRWDLLDAFDLSDNTRKYGGDGRSGYRTLMLYEIQDIIEEMPSYSEMPNKSDNGDLISRQDAIVQLSIDFPYLELPKIKESLDKLPSAEKTGYWIIIDDCEKFIAKCSECGQIEDSRMIGKYAYCHCGARMVEPQAESDHKCHNCKHYTSGERDGSCGSYICKHYSNWESEE